MILRWLLISVPIFVIVNCSPDHLVQSNVKLQQQNNKKKSQKSSKAEDNIPVIEIKGEGKPMTAAQIRALEEEAEGKPLDIKIKKTWVPKECFHNAKRKDFVTFHYKGFLEDGKKFDQTYGRDPITIQLGVGMTIPGLDKGLKGVCESELRKITVPWRLCRRRKSKMWKNVPKEEHWITFDVEIFHVEPWSPKMQFRQFDLNNDNFLTQNELTKYAEKLAKEYGKIWINEDIDNTMASRYFIDYFDKNGDKKIDTTEYETKIQSDMDAAKMTLSSKSPKYSRKRDPGMAWILDFNNDGHVTTDEVNMAPDLLAKGPKMAMDWVNEVRKNATRVKTEL